MAAKELPSSYAPVVIKEPLADTMARMKARAVSNPRMLPKKPWVAAAQRD